MYLNTTQFLLFKYHKTISIMGLFEDANKFYEKAVNLPGAIAVVFLLSMIYPPLGFFPLEVTTSILIAFTIPAVYIFLINVIFNRDVKIGFHLLVVMCVSFGFYSLNKWPFDIHQLFAYSFFFVFGAFVSMIAYSIYYVLYRLGKRYSGNVSYRMRFFMSFLPTLIAMIFVGYLLSILFGYWLSTFEMVISQ